MMPAAAVEVALTHRAGTGCAEADVRPVEPVGDRHPFAYMFFPDLAKATAEFARVLKPGGRLCSSVWAGPGENPSSPRPAPTSKTAR
jgi:SAM-dependent methyltransferase